MPYGFLSWGPFLPTANLNLKLEITENSITLEVNNIQRQINNEFINDIIHIQACLDFSNETAENEQNCSCT